MQELEELLRKYQDNLVNTNLEMEEFLTTFPELDINSDILSQLDNDKLKKIEFLIPKLNLERQEREMIPMAFDYYYKNQGLNLNNLIIQDTNLENFVNLIKNLYLRLIKYKKDKIIEYKKIIDKDTLIIENITNVKKLLDSTDEVEMKTLISYLKELPISRDTILELTRKSLERNLVIYNQNTNLEVVEDIKIIPEDIMVPDDFDYQNAISVYLRKIDYFLQNLERDGNYQAEKYASQAKVVNLKDRLLSIKEDYDFCLENPDYFKEDIKNVQKEIKVLLAEIDMEIDSYEASFKEDENIESDKGRDLIFLSSTMKDINEFKRSICSQIISKNLYKRLHNLKNDEVVYGMPVTMIKTTYPINQLNAPRSTGGTPRIFYQIIDNKAIVLLLGIEGRDDISIFKQNLESRIKNSEYLNLIESFRLSHDKPTEISPYDKTMTNQDYLKFLLQNYKMRESDFFERFHSECYNPASIVR